VGAAYDERCFAPAATKMAGRRSFDALPIINCRQSTELASVKAKTPQGLVFCLTVLAGFVGATAGVLPLFEWATRCLWNKNRLACLGSIFSQCKLVIAYRLLGAACCVVMIYVTFGHLLVFHIVFRCDFGRFCLHTYARF